MKLLTHNKNDVFPKEVPLLSYILIIVIKEIGISNSRDVCDKFKEYLVLEHITGIIPRIYRPAVEKCKKEVTPENCEEHFWLLFHAFQKDELHDVISSGYVYYPIIYRSLYLFRDRLIIILESLRSIVDKQLILLLALHC